MEGAIYGFLYYKLRRDISGLRKALKEVAHPIGVEPITF